MKITPVAIIDTREQTPWQFTNLRSTRRSLYPNRAKFERRFT